MNNKEASSWQRAFLASRTANLVPGLRRIAELAAERDTLRSERDGLRSERDGLRSAQAALEAEKDGLRSTQAALEAERDGLKSAYIARTAELEAHISALTQAAIERERKLQEKENLDYQILMTHQNLVAALKDIEPPFHALYERCKAYSMTSAERLYSLYKSIEYVVAACVPGDVAECGVWLGGSCMLMALSLLEFGPAQRRLLMFDTFEGHPKPDAERDVDLWGNRAVEDWQTHADNHTTWGYASVDEVRSNIEGTGYPPDKLLLIKGMVEETIPQHIPEQLAILRLDTDWYEFELASHSFTSIQGSPPAAC